MSWIRNSFIYLIILVAVVLVVTALVLVYVVNPRAGAIG